MSDTHAPRIEVFPSTGALALATAAVVAEALNRRLIRGPGRARLLATGGSTPVACYEALSDWPLDWSRVDVALTDDRFVPPGSPDSNEGLVRQHLLKGPAAAASFIPLWSDAASPEEAAVRAEPAIRALLPMDAVVLGVGEDGHVASLFPETPELAEGLDPRSERLVIGVPKAGLPPQVPRISLTLPALLNAGLIVVLIVGAAKKQAVEAALAGAKLPVRAVLAQSRAPVRILWAQ
ncbi:MAG TPA: 6-phosphogluconolactonase [Caulobacteraceae bacterium]